MSDDGEPVVGSSDLVLGADQRLRCPWACSAPDYQRYHDEEWGRPVTDDVGLFERMSLEAFQSGLSWLTILRRRDGFRQAFAGFDPAVLVGFGEQDVERLLADTSIVRNRAKIEAVIGNAGAFMGLDRPLGELLWSFADTSRPRPRRLADVPATTPGSTAMAKELRRRGFRFVGPTTAYALMQATGMVDDHLWGCCC